MKASEDLRKEHEIVLEALEVLENISNRIDKNEWPEISDLREFVDFLIVFADKCHHGKEEIYYFPALEKVGIPNHGGPVGAMLQDHEQGRTNIRMMKESVFGVQPDYVSFAKAAKSYIHLMKSHILKENNVLFMAGDRMLPENLQKELLEKFEEHEENVIGEGMHDQLHATLHKFHEKYHS